MSQQAPYVTLDVFTSERFKGNPLAVVDISNINLTHQRKQQIAREFNFSETVFLHHEPGQNPRAEIFTPVNEMEFAGHPVIGTGHLLFKDIFAGQKSLTLETKAGPVEIEYDGQKVVSAGVPHNIHVHEREAPVAALASVQDVLSASDINGTYPTVSIVKGVTYVLADLTERPDVFSNIAAGASPTVDLDDGWSPSFVGTMYYRQLESRTEGDPAIWNLRVRMIAINLEDPACGSGSCALGAFLALRNGQQKHRFYIDQGLEMGRDSHIIVDIELNAARNGVERIKLAGPAAFVAEGKMSVD
ncbi:hypothetical protein ASPWEDRAFT_49852 [Aspergillus wentii DTO 134E9]|uniref:Phenazine biosynthesis protein n=1 Tax=Aspergillus wentii DTO 134E9 TaxID=1073089 RepID=A0A1L9RMZ4_ASPWE|nr:uncharacterized protein ASPWEDRAFT_49852 [Aspergillus wentii DTO 134E9]OJJ36320.1 hypothetical protein ASPWEDRAFT_49852 [Aspergillus wentii DTO 134E9]